MRRERIALVLVLANSIAGLGCNRVLGIHEKQETDAAPEVPGFRLSLASSSLRLIRGKSATVDVTIQRSGGFGGEVRITVLGAPNGVTADPLALGSAQTSATLTLQAASSADRGSATLQVYGLSDVVSANSESVQLVVQDASGSEDLTFGALGGTPGSVRVSAGTGGQGVGPSGLQLVTQSGAIVLCGHARTDQAASSLMLARLSADGALDVSFNGAGLVLTNSVASSGDGCNAMFLRAGGGINLAGYATPADAGTRDIMVGRYTPAGRADLNTGNGGFATTHVDGTDSVANGLLPSDNDSYVIGGSGAGQAAFVRYQKYGAIDPSFGVNGVATVGPDQTAALWLASQASGNIVAAVAAPTFRVARLTPVGKLDTSFASSGVADVGAAGSVAAVVLVTPQPKDALLVVGTIVQPSGARDIAIVRLTELGQVDPTYGAAGWAFAHFGAVAAKSSVSSAALQDDGAVVVAGQTPSDQGDAFSVIRFTAEGVPDPAFGPGGRRTFDAPGFAQAIALDSLQRIVVAGVAGAGDSPDGIVVYRLWP